jgi:hypothetical protein
VKIELVGYQPDLDTTQVGTIIECAAWIPSIKGGYKGAPAAATTTTSSALAAACRGAATIQKLDGSARVFAGTGVKLYEAIGSSWTNRTRSVGGDYTLSTAQRWRFAQFGDATIACGSTTSGDILQVSTTAAFADIAGSPRAEVVETVKNFVMVFSTVDGTYGTRGDSWWCSGINDHTIWTPSIANQSATGQLRGGSGPIRGAKRFGDQIIAYKDNAMFFGQYVGQPEIWRWTQIPGTQGALSHESIVNIGTDALPRHFFIGLDDFYIFDGSRAQPVGLPVKHTVFGSINRAYSASCAISHDAVNGLVYCFYPVSGSVNPEKCVVYNYRTGKWGRDDRTIEAVLEYIAPSITYGDLGTYYSTYGDFPSAPYGSFALSSASQFPGIFNTSHVLQTLTGAAGTSSFSLGDIGEDRLWSTLSSVKPRFLEAPNSASMTNAYKDNVGDSPTTDQTVSLSDEKKFDAMRSARWHRLSFSFSGDVEFFVLDADVKPDGAY